MVPSSIKHLGFAFIAATLCLQAGFAKDQVALSIPMRSHMSPVQRLNRDGVEAVRKNQYEKAEALFYKAYLFDPSDPFTLNNLGYVAELQGQLDRAHKFYEMATEQGCDAPIDISSLDSLKGKPMMAAYQKLQDIPMQVNRMNLDAMQLLAENRGFEAAVLLEQALKRDPQNPFTMNNLAVADEAIGDNEGALKYYTAVANLHSSEQIAVTQGRGWRGKTISEMAESSANTLKKRMQTSSPNSIEAAKYNIRGVHEENENDWEAARQDFLRAYSLDPNSAFSLNNRGYIAEREGDMETAQFYYNKAGKANDSSLRVGWATNHTAEGKPLLDVATDSNQRVDSALRLYGAERRRESAPVELTPRGAGEDTTEPAPQEQPNVPQNPQ
jgi:tetratricopeptide (TPR) repeat protein